MIELENAATRTPLVLDNTDTINTDLSKQCGEIVDRLLIKDLEYTRKTLKTLARTSRSLKKISQIWTQLLLN